MQIKRRALTAGATFFLAAATGHVMQNGVVFPSAFTSATEPAAPAQPGIQTSDAVAAGAVEPIALKLPDLPKASAPQLSSGTSLATRVRSTEGGYSRKASAADVEYSAFGMACAAPSLDLSAAADASVALHLSAPCAPSERVAVEHAGLVFDAVTGPDGELRLTLPAMAESAKLSVTMASGDTLEGDVSVPGFSKVQRVALQWHGVHELALDAYENGASWGDDGHVSLGAMTAGDHGSIVLLGNPDLPDAKVAVVYTGSSKSGPVGLEVSSEVSRLSCGRTLSGEIVRPGTGAEPISLSMPSCDALGGYVVMKVDPIAASPMAVASAGN